MTHLKLPLRLLVWATFSVASIAGFISEAAAQPLGTFRWQLQPYCNVVTLAVTQNGGFYTLDGADDQCGAGQLASIVGTAFLNPDGSIGLGLSTVTVPGGAPVHIDARINLSSLSGPWRDSAGNGGTFVFTPGPSTGGPPRPVAPNGLPPGSITAAQLAPGAVGPSQLAPGSVGGSHIVDKSITSADVLDGPRAAFASGNQVLALNNLGAIVRSVTIAAPTAGHVIVNASGYFRFSSAASADFGVCSITTGTGIDASHEVVAGEQQGAAMGYVPFGATRGFSVAAGSTTFRLVCSEPTLSGDIEVHDTSLTAIFVAGS